MVWVRYADFFAAVDLLGYLPRISLKGSSTRTLSPGWGCSFHVFVYVYMYIFIYSYTCICI